MQEDVPRTIFQEMSNFCCPPAKPEVYLKEISYVSKFISKQKLLRNWLLHIRRFKKLNQFCSLYIAYSGENGHGELEVARSNLTQIRMWLNFYLSTVQVGHILRKHLQFTNLPNSFGWQYEYSI